MIRFWSKFYFQSFGTALLEIMVPTNPLSSSPRKILPPEFLDTSTTALVCISSSILNSEIEGWKYRSRELFIIHLKFFSDICMKCLNPQVRINKMVNEHTVNYHLSPSELTSRIHPLLFLWTPMRFIFSPEYFSIFSQTCILQHGCRKVTNSWC